jgi:hypothetical protein
MSITKDQAKRHIARFAHMPGYPDVSTPIGQQAAGELIKALMESSHTEAFAGQVVEQIIRDCKFAPGAADIYDAAGTVAQNDAVPEWQGWEAPVAEHQSSSGCPHCANGIKGWVWSYVTPAKGFEDQRPTGARKCSCAKGWAA